MSLLYKRSVLLAAIETTPGTAETLTSSDGAHNIYEATLTPSIDFVERPVQGGFARVASVPSGYRGQCTFTTYFDGWDGSSSKPAWASKFFPACGWVLKGGTNIYRPVTEAPGSNVKTLTIELYRDGRKAQLTGAMGSFTINITPGQPPSINWTFEGVWQGVSDASVPSPTLPTEKPLRYAGENADAAWNSARMCFQTATIESGNTLYVRPCGRNAASQAAAGFVNALVTDRLPRATINPDATLVATQDRYGKLLDMSEHTLEINIPGAAGAVSDASVDISMPDAQLVSAADADREGLLSDALEFQANLDSSNGVDHELQIEFTPLADA
jgi:hypothetical protein